MSILDRTQKALPHDRGDGRVLPQRTDELQRLYDRWRDSMECQAFESLLQLNQDRVTLQVPPLGRSLSQRSGGSSSSTLSASSTLDDDDELDEHDRRPRRRGPLTKSKREKTAFIRRLGACDSCRARKVGCTHWDLTEFEEWYQLAKQCSKIHLQGHEELSPASHGDDLLGLEPHSPLTPMSQFQMETDLAALPRSSPISPISPMASPNPMLISSESHDDQGFPATRMEHLFKVQLMRDRLPTAIGKEVAAAGNNGCRWQCQFDYMDAWATRNAASLCQIRFETPDQIIEHFSAAHHPIELPDQPYWYRCSLCRQWGSDYQCCPKCGAVGSGSREKAIYGYAVHARQVLPRWECESIEHKQESSDVPVVCGWDGEWTGLELES
ncbi:hypothetical protein EDB81DRAFT_49254 [Dactylonectria macrodidyma]|uniref:Uncharacterized protein n=1 Tax=Dactylonectria macrodidyma TaxID=307937 RepID=A0A9P9FVG3_9HYPO|nr:hypothetical protein EDB81DRAFT_49254 [Dactylonectria macrodidyma]